MAIPISSKNFGSQGILNWWSPGKFWMRFNALYKSRRLNQRLQLQDGEEALIVDLIKQKASIVTTDRYQIDKIVEDPTDNKFLACAF